MSDVFGSKPDVAPYIPTDFSAEQLKSLTENIDAFPDITQLGDLYQTYMLADLNRAMPGFSDLLSSGAATSQEMLDASAPLLRGEIPQDVQQQVQRSSAYQSLMSGTAGSPMAGALTARDLGLTSLGLKQQGAQLATSGGNAAQRWAGLAEGTMMNPSSMLITPQQQAALTMQNNLYKQQTLQFANDVKAAPDPVAQGISDTIINLIGAYLSKGGGGKTASTYSQPQSANLQYQSDPGFFNPGQPGPGESGWSPGYYDSSTYNPYTGSPGGGIGTTGSPGGGDIGTTYGGGSYDASYGGSFSPY